MTQLDLFPEGRVQRAFRSFLALLRRALPLQDRHVDPVVAVDPGPQDVGDQRGRRVQRGHRTRASQKPQSRPRRRRGARRPVDPAPSPSTSPPASLTPCSDSGVACSTSTCEVQNVDRVRRADLAAVEVGPDKLIYLPGEETFRSPDH